MAFAIYHAALLFPGAARTHLCFRASWPGGQKNFVSVKDSWVSPLWAKLAVSTLGASYSLQTFFNGLAMNITAKTTRSSGTLSSSLVTLGVSGSC